MDEIRKRLYDAYKEKGLSYAELEEKTGIPAATINRYVEGKTQTVPTVRMEKLAKALDVDLFYLIGFTDTKSGFDYSFQNEISYRREMPDSPRPFNGVSDSIGAADSIGTSDSIGSMGAGVNPISAGVGGPITAGLSESSGFKFGVDPKPVNAAMEYTVMLRKIGDALPRTPGEIDLLSAYRALDEEGKSALIRVARAFLVDHKR